jgi:hypothetical protein
MNTEHQAWTQLRERAASLISPGFPDRVMRAIRARSSPLLVANFAMCAATAALCLVAVAIYRARLSTDENDQNLAGWSEISAQADEFGQGL